MEKRRKTTARPTFGGFRSPNYTPVPDEVFDELADVLSSAELRVLLYIIRRTFGFKKICDNISFSQLCRGITTKDGQVLDRGTGLSKSTVAVAIKSLLEKKIIVVQRNKSAERGYEPTTYSLNFADTPLSDFRTRGVREIGQGLSGRPDIQQTVVQQTDIQTNVNVKLIKKDENDSDRNERESLLVADLMEQLYDTNKRSKATFRKIVVGLGHHVAYRLLGNTKEAYRDGIVSRNKMAAYFVGMAINVAAEQGIDLGFKTKNGQPIGNGNQPNASYPVNGMIAGLADLKSGFRNRARSLTGKDSTQ